MRGIGPTLVGIVPYASASFGTFEHLKPVCQSRRLGTDGTVGKMIAGSLAGIVAQTVAYPFDVVRRRLQVAPEKFGHHVDESCWHEIRSIFRNGGWRGFFVGLSINYIKIAPMTGMSFVVYDMMKKLLNIDIQNTL